MIVPSSLSVAVTFANGSKVSPTFNVTSFAEIVGAVLSSPCEFNLNIPRYVDTFEKEEDVDLNALLTDMKKTDEELEQVQGEFLSLLKDLTSNDETIMSSLNDLIGKIEG